MEVDGFQSEPSGKEQPKIGRFLDRARQAKLLLIPLVMIFTRRYDG